MKDPLGNGETIVRMYSGGPTVRNNFLGSKTSKEGMIKAAIVIQKFIRRFLANIRVEKIKARMVRLLQKNRRKILQSERKKKAELLAKI